MKINIEIDIDDLMDEYVNGDGGYLNDEVKHQIVARVANEILNYQPSNYKADLISLVKEELKAKVAEKAKGLVGKINYDFVVGKDETTFQEYVGNLIKQCLHEKVDDYGRPSRHYNDRDTFIRYEIRSLIKSLFNKDVKSVEDIVLATVKSEFESYKATFAESIANKALGKIKIGI